MARLNFPNQFWVQLQLLADVKAKHDALGAASPLAPYLAHQGIDLAACAVAGAEADAYHQQLNTCSLKKENNTAQRNLLFNPVWEHVTGSFAYLKILFAPNYKQVGEWGAPVLVSGRIKYPADFMKRTVIFTDFLAKHNSFILPAVSPLQAYFTQNNISPAADNAAVIQAMQHHLASLDFSGKAEDAREKRDNLWKPIAAQLRGIGAFLIKLYGDNTKEAGEWGFIVDDNKRAPKLRTTKLMAGGEMYNKSVTIGGTFTNLGKTVLIIYKGRKGSATFITIQPGEVITIPKGFSIITIVNNSSITEGKFSLNCF